jgi:pectinesterase
MLQPEAARFSQYRPRGPGAAAFPRGRTLTKAEAKAMSVDAVLTGWKV